MKFASPGLPLICIFFLTLSLVDGICSPQPSADSVVMKFSAGKLEVKAAGTDILHVIFSPDKDYQSPSILKTPQVQNKIKTQVTFSGDTVLLRTTSLTCLITKESGRLILKKKGNGETVLEAILPPEFDFTHQKKSGKTTQSFRIDPEEGLYGIAPRRDSLFNLHNRKVSFDPVYADRGFPFLLSTRNYAILWVSSSGTVFDCGEERMSFSSENAAAVDFYIVCGRNSDDVIAGYRQLTGLKPLLPGKVWLGASRSDSVDWVSGLYCSYNSLKEQIISFINLGMSGNPYPGIDIGDMFKYGCKEFYPLTVHDLAYRELFIRWFQFGIFTPAFLTSLSLTLPDVNYFGEDNSVFYQTLVKWDLMRQRFLPYLNSLGWKVRNGGYTILRGLPMDFPDDHYVYDIPDEYMFGSAFLVKPVTKNQYFMPRPDTLHSQEIIRGDYDSVDVYLPGNAEWFDLYTGRKFSGGQTVKTPSPLEVIPVYVRSGSIIPYGPLLQQTPGKPEEPVQIRVYPGSDASFILVEHPETLERNSDSCSSIPLYWNDEAQTITFGQRVGERPGIRKFSNFRVILYTGIIPETGYITTTKDKLIRYDGTGFTYKMK